MEPYYSAAPSVAIVWGHMSSTLCRGLAACLVVLCSTAATAAGMRSPFAELFALNTPNYTGGLTKADRAVAERIHAAMRVRYTETCPPPQPEAGALLSIGSGTEATTAAPADRDLGRLLRALDSPRQEVRDVAAYTIGLLGPSAKAARSLLGAGFSSQSSLGGWYNFAYERVVCVKVVSANFRQTIPAALLPPNSPWKEFLKASATLIAKLYLNEDIEYPPGMMSGAYWSYGLVDVEAPSALLAAILSNPKLSLQKRREAADALARIDPKYSNEARPALLRALREEDASIRHYAAQALIRLRDKAAIPVVIEKIGNDDGWASWDNELCGYGHDAIAAQDRLQDVATHSLSPGVARHAVHALGCIGATASLPALVSMLRVRDWQLNVAAANAIGALGSRDEAAETTLRILAKSHWSSKVRAAAMDALEKIGAVLDGRPPKTDDGNETIVITNGTPLPFNHGLPWCDNSGRYSIDGRTWFKVEWHERTLQAVPERFPTPRVLQGVGTHAFVRVDDGWLFGSDGFEATGVFLHVSEAGVIDDLDPGATISGIAEHNGVYFAYGYELLKSGNAGVLFQVARSPDGRWRAARLLTLPSVASAHAFAPGGELLLSDGPNDYAVVEGDIVPLRCEKHFPGSYFDKNPEGTFF